MKKYLLFPILGLFTLGSCKQSNTDVIKATLDDNASWIRGEYTARFSHGESNKDTTLAQIHYAYATKENGLKSISDSLILSLFAIEKKVTVDKSLFEGEANAFVSEFEGYYKEKTGNMFPWYSHISIDFCDIDARFVKLEFESDAYTGGAHGSHNVTYFMLDKQQKTRVKLSDVFTDLKTLESRVEAAFRKTYGFATDADLNKEGFWFENSTFKMNDNFYFDKEHLVFVFNQYEIGPYAIGMFTVQVPLNELKDISNL